MNRSEIKNIEKKRAEFAYDCVENFLKKNKKLNEIKKEIENKKINCKEDKDNDLCKEKKELEIYSSPSEYKSYVKKIPTMIQTNGLSATFAFMFSKKKTYKIIYQDVERWLREERKLKENDEELIKWLISLESPKYKHITSEVMALFMWLRRFAEGMIEKEKGSENGEEKKEEK